MMITKSGFETAFVEPSLGVPGWVALGSGLCKPWCCTSRIEGLNLKSKACDQEDIPALHGQVSR